MKRALFTLTLLAACIAFTGPTGPQKPTPQPSPSGPALDPPPGVPPPCTLFHTC